MELTLGLLTLACSLFSHCSQPSASKNNTESKKTEYFARARLIESLEHRFSGDEEPLKWTLAITKEGKTVAEKKLVLVAQILDVFNKLTFREDESLSVALTAELAGDLILTNVPDTAKKNEKLGELWNKYCDGGRVTRELSAHKFVNVCILQRGVIEGTISTALMPFRTDMRDL